MLHYGDPLTIHMPPADWTSRGVSAADAVSLITSGMRVFAHGAAATPTPLLAALAQRTDLEEVRLYHMHTEGAAPWTEPGIAERIRSVALFCGPSLREPVADGRADFVPVFLSDIPSLFQNGIVPLDVAIVQLSPPDRHGFCSLGTSVDCARAAVDTARFVIAEINERMPRTHGNTAIPFERIDAFVASDRPLLGRLGYDVEVALARLGREHAGRLRGEHQIALALRLPADDPELAVA